jgi:hypothetical protein
MQVMGQALLSSVLHGFGGRDSDSPWTERFEVRTPVSARFSVCVQTGPEAHPAFCTIGTGSLYLILQASKRIGQKMSLQLLISTDQV